MQTNSHLAAIDVGTNSFHLIVVRVNENGSFEIVDREKEVIRLGLGSSPDKKHIQPDAQERAIATLKRFKTIASSYDAVIRAVATSAVRESLNRNEFIQRVYDETGIEIQVISGIEEARLIYLGILQAVPVFNSKVLCIDIGGGSTEMIIGQQGRMLFAKSLKLGAVRLSQMFFPDFEVSKSAVEKCTNWVSGEIYSTVKEIKKIGFETAVGASGTIMAAALMIQAKKSGSMPENMLLNNYQFHQNDLQKVTDAALKKASVKERKKIKGLDEKRADIIPAGLIILNTIVKALGLKEMTVSGYALREGTILDFMHKMRPLERKAGIEDIRMQSIQKLAEMCNYDKAHSQHVCTLALQIYDQMEQVHLLSPENREYLEAAATLHDVGYHISHSQHHKHSYYIIRNAEILGFSENEIEIIAQTARYHRKSYPKPSHSDYSKMAEKDKTVIRKLASILRVADSLDRTHASLIERIKVNVDPKTIHLTLFHNSEYPEIELWNLERRKTLMEEVFSREVTVSTEKDGLKEAANN
ncbi:MAG: Ppx/GppA family phosphatase [Ignavibacteria bacterium]|jgi:exopolyphosphatase/guanosine-5'-triphosphate,3'-diphosphate pyrophosphatase|nr:Ppx/GppA family phosphatase [Ignavibacteria bacterium]MCU7499781.1 Ppx/GppA family phosphatase [Ignavibacteria bacterium]MCU7513164.1 Ppx/GppA family phosphatase [Ignavibacteria bacterium]MCU7522052.1 Ppx/GppA family phosphatase [Ignavibacteria bacterium]